MFPPTNFHFRVLFPELEDPEQLDSHFASIDGLEARTSLMDDPEMNPLESSIPKPGFSVLTLKRAARGYGESALIRWLFLHFNNSGNHSWKKATIEILNEEHQPFMIFTIRNVFPKSWRLSELNAMNGDILMETIELYYEELLPMPL